MHRLFLQKWFLLVTAVTLLSGCAMATQSANELQPTSVPTENPTTARQMGSIKIDRERLPPAVNEATRAVEEYILVPHLVAPEEFYVEQALGAPVSGVAGFPMARLADAQAAAVQQVALFVAENGLFADEDEVGFGILSSIRYTFGDGRSLTISTTHLSPAALEQTISFSGSSVMLPTYGEAWLDTGIGLPTTPRGLNFVKDDFIITVTGELSADELLVIADQLLFD